MERKLISYIKLEVELHDTTARDAREVIQQLREVIREMPCVSLEHETDISVELVESAGIIG